MPEAVAPDETQRRVGIVEAWFGTGFDALDPLLQSLHRHGGTLEGAIDIRLGGGLAGRLGRRLARRLGIPPTAGRHSLQVDIRHDATTLHWDRRFDRASWMRSRFEPIGSWPDGCWRETTGPVQLRLAVDIVDGSWHWRTMGMRVRGLSLPLVLMPRTRAYKRVQDGRYQFHVGFSLPLLGEFLAYGGTLDLVHADSPAEPARG